MEPLSASHIQICKIRLGMERWYYRYTGHFHSHRKSSPDRLLCFHVSWKSPSSWWGLWKGLLPYESYFEEVRKHHVVFFECTLQNFLLLQNNPLDKISQGKPQPSWSFSETGTCQNQLQTQQPHWSPIHFSKWKLDGLFLSEILYNRSWVQIYLFFPHLLCVFTFQSQVISLLWKLLTVDTISHLHSRLEAAFYLPHIIKPSETP